MLPGLSAPVKSLVAPPCEAGPRLGEVGRRILAPKVSFAKDPVVPSQEDIYIHRDLPLLAVVYFPLHVFGNMPVSGASFMDLPQEHC